MFAFGFSSLLGRRARSRKPSRQGVSRPRSTFRPQIEALEERLAPIATPTSLGGASAATAVTSLASGAVTVSTGSTILVVLSLQSGVSGTVSCSDTGSGGSNTYHNDLDVTNAGNVRLVVFSAPVTHALSSGTITVSFPSAAQSAVSFASDTGLLQASYLDTTSSSTGNSTLPNSGAAATSQGSELLLGAFAVQDKATGNNQSGTPGTGYFDPTMGGGSNGFTDLFCQSSTSNGSATQNVVAQTTYQLVSTTASYTASGSIGGQARQWAAGILAYKGVTNTAALTSITIGAQSPTFVTANGTASYLITVSRSDTIAGETATVSLNTSSLPGTSSTNLPFTVTFAGTSSTATGTLTIANSGTATGSYAFTLKATSSNTVTSSSATLAVDATNPTSGITFPADSGNYNTAGWTGTITGTASDSGGSNVASEVISIADNFTGLYWNGSAFSSASQVFVAVTNTGTNFSTWSYALAVGNLTSGHTYTIRSKATDGAGNVQSTLGAATFTFDTVAPTAVITFPINLATYNASGWTAGGLIKGTASDTGGSGVASDQVSIKDNNTNLYWNGSTFTNASETYFNAVGTTSWTYNTTPAASALTTGHSYTVHARAIDNAGNVQFSVASNVFTYNIALPHSTITFPANGGFYNTAGWTGAITGTTTAASGQNITSEQVSIQRLSDSKWWNGTSFVISGSEILLNATNTGTSFSTWSLTFAVGNLTSGVSYTVHAIATDNLNNVETPPAASSTFGFDTALPASTITFPANGGSYNSLGWTSGSPIAGTASDTGGAGIQKVEVSIFDSTANKYWNGSSFVTSGSEIYILASGTTAWSYSALTSGFLTNGDSYTVHSRATDNANNVQSPVTAATFTFDTTAPTVTSITLPGTNPTNATSVTYTVNFSESVATVTTSNFSLVTTGAVSGSITGLSGSGAGPYTVTVTSVSGNGTMALRMANSTGVSDTAGNAVSNVPFTSSAYTIDQTSPVPVINTNPPNPDTNHSPTFTFSATDPTVGGVSSGVNHLETKLDGGSFSTQTSPQALSGLADGSHTFYVRAVDNAGNVSSAVSYTWFIETVSDVQVQWGTAGSASILSMTSNLPWYQVKTIDIVFASDVSGHISQSDLALTGVNVANYNIGNSGSASFSYNSGTKTATWTLVTPINIDRLMMSLSGGIYTKNFNVLPGDVNNDGLVNSQDLTLIQQHFTSSVAYNALYDINGDGFVDINDYTLTRSFIGDTLP
jgi:hypothetical protein